MSATIDYLPVWKRGATPEERFLELAAIAKAHPERFAKMLTVWVEYLDDGEHFKVQYLSDNLETLELLGLLTMTIEEVHAKLR